MSTLIFGAKFDKTTAGKAVGVNGLTISWDIDQITKANGTRTAVASGEATNIVIGRRGLYGYVLTDAFMAAHDLPAIDLQTYEYIATACTAGDVDAGEVSAMRWDAAEAHDAELANLDATISSRAAASIFAGITVLANWLRGLYRKDAMNATAKTEVNSGGGAYNEATDSLEAARDNIGSAGAGLTAVDPLANEVPGDYASGSAGAALGRIGRGIISVVSPVAENGDVDTWQDGEYKAEYGTALEWTDEEAQWPTLTDAEITVILHGEAEFDGSVITATGAGKKVRLELESADSLGIDVGQYRFQVWAEWDAVEGPPAVLAHKHCLVEGNWMSHKRYAA